MRLPKPSGLSWLNLNIIYFIDGLCAFLSQSYKNIRIKNLMNMIRNENISNGAGSTGLKKYSLTKL